MTTFADLVAEYGATAKSKLSGPGEREALLSAPVATFVERVGALAGHLVVAHNEVMELDGTVRPDFGVRVNGVLTGHIELKAPGVSLDPSTYRKTSHNFRQWQRLKELPNLLHTNGTEWRLWRFGELVDNPVHIHSDDLRKTRGSLTAPSRLELIINSFLAWSPSPIVSVGKLVETLAPLARMLREEVLEALRAEKAAVKSGADKDLQPFTGMAKDWRAMLFPQAKNDEFADGFAQTVVFALVLAVSEGIDIGSADLHQIAQRLESHHTLMGRALNLLTAHIKDTPTGTAVEMISRTLSGAIWERISGSGDDIYLHLYEHFLGVYDPERRRGSGSYYTPVEVVDAMVRLTDEALKLYFNRPQGLRNPNVAIVDPAMGTGTYPLSVLRQVATSAAQQYGPAAASEAVASAVERLYGLELQSGPFSVAELRITSALRDLGAELPETGLNLFVADTLEDPESGSRTQLSYTLQLIAQQRRRANAMKRDVNVQVVIGNPPYRERAGGDGGWLENGTDPRTGEPPLAAFRSPGNGRAEFTLSNLYIYFWRWATWKVFESTAEPNREFGDTGIVAYITATGYLTGPGFKGMREYLRRKCSHGWIINVTPEGKKPPAKNAVFNIETPVAIGIFARTPDVDETVPAEIKYLDIHGTTQEKFAQLADLQFDDARWRLARTAWQAPFTPAAATSWDDYPAVGDLLPWVTTGVTPNRNWVIGPDKGTLELRLQQLLAESDAEKKSAAFKTTDTSSLDRGKEPLPGDAAEKETRTALSKVPMVTDVKYERITFRSFDRQWVIADSRLLDRPRRPLWEARHPGQIFVVEQHSIHPRQGPALYFSGSMPDINAFNNRGGRTLPMLHPDGSPNLVSGLLEVLVTHFGAGIDPTDLVYYLAGVTAHPGFVETFDDELTTPGIRVPMTADRALWDRAVQLGKHAVWLHSFGTAGGHPDGIHDIRSPQILIAHPSYNVPVGKRMPTSLQYDADAQELRLGNGVWAPVSAEVRNYTVGGVKVIDSWVGYRMEKPKGRRSSPFEPPRHVRRLSQTVNSAGCRAAIRA